MSFRTVVITKQCKCSYKNGYLIVRKEDTKMIHLSEIYCVILDTTAVSISAYLIVELLKRKVAVVFCDEQHNPLAQTLPLYGSHNTSKKVQIQTAWTEHAKKQIWTMIIHEKIKQQALHLRSICSPDEKKLFLYLEQMEYNDNTNREGHAAKVYFNSLFGKMFSRNNEDDINAALDYGYSILLSAFNKEVILNGFITQLGICHKNEFNKFNLASDIMEPFRPIVDRYVYSKLPFEFNADIRCELIDLLNSLVLYDGKKHHLSTVISLYTKDILNRLSNDLFEPIKFYEVL